MNIRYCVILIEEEPDEEDIEVPCIVLDIDAGSDSPNAFMTEDYDKALKYKNRMEKAFPRAQYRLATVTF